MYDVNGYWHFGNLEGEHNKDFDNLIAYCVSRDGKIIERIYIFPKVEIIKRISITIMENPKKWIPWYEKYRIKDKKILDLVNKIYQEILEDENQ